MSIASTISDLRRWGRQSRRIATGFPSMSCFMRAWFGRGSTGPETEDSIVSAIDNVVCRAPTHVKNLLIIYYCRRDSLRRIATYDDCSIWSVRKRLDEANWYVHTELENVAARQYNFSNTVDVSRPRA